MNKLTDCRFKAAGVTFANPDGISRQLIIANLMNTTGDKTKITLVREPNNAYDKNAIAIFANDNLHVGYIPKQYATLLAPMIDEGRKFTAKAGEIGKYKDTYFVHIIVDEE